MKAGHGRSGLGPFRLYPSPRPVVSLLSMGSADLGARVRQSLGGVALQGFFEGLSRLGRLHPEGRLSGYGLEIERNIDYRGTGLVAHRLDAWRPPGTSKGTVLFVHGGGFRILSKDTHWMMALMFARAGYLVFSINYRLAPKDPFPAGLEDTMAAYRWVVDNAHRFGGDPDRLVLAGESAGANLILGLTLALCSDLSPPCSSEVASELGLVLEQSPRPKAVLPACGLLEVTRPERYLDRPEVPRLVKDRLAHICGQYLGPWGTDPRPETALSSPVCVLEGTRDLRGFPPAYLPVGDKDPILEDTRRLARALDRRGLHHVLDVYPGQPHAFHALFWRPAAQACWSAQLQFVEEVLG